MKPENVLKSLEKALEKYGTYSFDDKGPEEVMSSDILKTSEFLKTQTKQDAAKFLKELAECKGYKNRNTRLAQAILSCCDDIEPEEWFEYVVENSGVSY